MPRKRMLSDQEIMEKARRLSYLIDFSKINRKDLCENTDIKPDTLYRWMNGKLQGIGPSGAKSLLNRLQDFGILCTQEWLLTGEGKGPSRFHQWSLSPETPEDRPYDLLLLDREIQFFHQNHPNGLGIFLNDQSMHPIFGAGDYLAGVKTEYFDKLIGDYCLVELENTHQILACRLEKGTKPEYFTLLALNPTESRPLVLLDQKIESAARIIWRRRLVP